MIEAFSAGATRSGPDALIRPRRRDRARYGGGLRAALLIALVATLLRHPLRALVSATIGWLLFSAALICGVLAVGLTWPATRAAFLSGGTDSVERSVGLFVVAALLAGVYVRRLGHVRAGLGAALGALDAELVEPLSEGRTSSDSAAGPGCPATLGRGRAVPRKSGVDRVMRRYFG